ncbi:type II toxin-antitoxin system PemK/MazF family toxin [Nostocoides sp. F2B08]|uniref:type II toxin-antitoxin system PemK/MazF family toxin n=1 Tax=Nostocoides sp. F2B08 TaxID=2653936 RepID=UPI001263E00F|nr:type II toxin-antitoxin system PemK/MazF family toxin [Tetrasphaera sp. F2B08]KAB7744763.1 type II toxin-antitoxin system PemK/MazF family toxin [Tetrasphaera sp. F2B08]
MANTLLRSILGTVQREVDRALRRQARTSGRPRPVPTAPSPARGRAAEPSAGYPGDFRGRVEIAYAPHPDGEPDPGEIVWAWVPYEEDHSQGKDRPVLLIGRDGPWLLALQMTSRDHDRDEAQERRAGRIWVDIGSGAWDRQGRPSEVRVNRVLRIDPDRIRREGAVLARDRFDAVAEGVLRHA